jgi:hypothetical protein
MLGNRSVSVLNLKQGRLIVYRMRGLPWTREECAIERKGSKKRALDLWSLTAEVAMWQKSAFAKREILVQLQEDFGFW